MNHTLEIIRGICLIVSFSLLLGVVLLRWYQKTDENKAWLVCKWLVTVLVGYIYVKGFAAGPFVVIFALISAGLMIVLWAGPIAGYFGNQLGNLYDGGNEPPEPKAYYSVARGLMTHGRYPQAVEEVKKQLAMFPTDYEGQLLQAEIQARHLSDLPAAEATIQALCEQPGQTPSNVAAALTALADWQLKLARDREAARRSLSQIISLFPDSQFSTQAAQRIAHLGDAEMYRPPAERQKYPVPEGIKNFGLVQEAGLVKPREISPEARAAEYVKHLEEHPLDTEVREKLALLYAENYQRLDLAVVQLEDLLAQPNQPARQVIHWLNLMADWQIKFASDYDAAKLALQRIMDRFPDTAAAEMARSRMELLRLEVKAKGKSQAVKLGSYEQNIGLKMGLPH